VGAQPGPRVGVSDVRRAHVSLWVGVDVRGDE
jgi:hypothetical protein